jgi:hypothetical protein
MAREWEAATPKDKKLPEHVKTKTKEAEDLTEGGRVEMEHEGTIKKIKANPQISVEEAANSIGAEHTDESKNYYTHLARMENELENEKKAAFWDELEAIKESGVLERVGLAARKKVKDLAPRLKENLHHRVADIKDRAKDFVRPGTIRDI